MRRASAPATSEVLSMGRNSLVTILVVVVLILVVIFLLQRI
ncbi:hypothetical protein BH24ACT14_BH24ACT14_15460 [soil metagenome]|jgi:preprotein translocase subunit YajC